MSKAHIFTLSGLHCGKCVGRIQAALAPFAEGVLVSLSPMQVQLTALKPNTKFEVLQRAVREAGNYDLARGEALGTVQPDSIQVVASANAHVTGVRSWLATYRPLLLIFGFLLTTSVLVQMGHPSVLGSGFSSVTAMETMRYFMAGFFLVFAFFKLLDIEAFSDAYAGYDLVAARWPAWGRVYPFVELGLGVAYLSNVAPLGTLWVTVIVMGVSAVGVVRAVLDKRRIRCACLGTVFQLPMSTVTIVEDLGMVLMATWMLALS